MNRPNHLSDIYYLPSWQGGDVQRPLCHRGRLNLSPPILRMTGEVAEVTCNACRKRLGLPPLTSHEVSGKPRLPALSRVQLDTTRAQIAREVALAHGLALADMKTPSKVRRLAWPRQEAMARMIEAGFSTTAAGGFFGRDHTTAIHAWRAVVARQEAAE